MAARFEDKLPLFDRLGGRIFTALIAEKFCDRMLWDAKLEEIFRDANPELLKKTVADRACEFLAGDNTHTETALKRIGEQVSFTDSHFNRCISHLIAALVWAGINRELIEEVLDLVTPYSADLVRPEQTYPRDNA